MLKHRQFYVRTPDGLRLLGNAVKVCRDLETADVPGVHIITDNLWRERDVVDKLSYYVRPQVEPHAERELKAMAKIGARLITNRYISVNSEDLEPKFIFKPLQGCPDRLPEHFDELFCRLPDLNRPFPITYFGDVPPHRAVHVWVLPSPFQYLKDLGIL